MANQKYKERNYHFMTDFTIAGPIIGLLAVVDVAVHLRLDLRKSEVSSSAFFAEPPVVVPRVGIVLVAISTLLSFFLVFGIIIAWMTGLDANLFWFAFLLASPPAVIWVTGLVMLSLGILLHCWSRIARQEMAASWAMSQTHKLVTDGPYARVRHPSYLSYLLCFAGLFLLLPSILCSILFIGFPGYYIVAVNEELLLVNHFGDEYREYMERTKRFFPF
ncbi:MAG: isoprenylcysteine carboxylmethyltransferase family protein [Candidatus Thorarchaeota archaeon]|nr:isoprenylcysteine carboxylmethyltransferase family protein [Candidatus Thorarchaeota archaeon]